jgi:hypothetical protein
VKQLLTYKEKFEEYVDVAPVSNLSLSIRNLLIEEISSDLGMDGLDAAGLAKMVRERMDILPMRKRECFKRVVGVDAGSQIIPLAARQYAVFSALAYSLPQGSRFFLQPESMSCTYSMGVDRFKGSVNLCREAKLYETAYKFIENGNNPELVLIDGPLAFSSWWQKTGTEKERLRLFKSIRNLLNTSQEKGIIIAGIVKRPSARYLIHYHRLAKDTDLSDSFLMHLTLKEGERTDIFSINTALMLSGKNKLPMNLAESPIYSTYCRTTNDWSIPPIRIDVPAYSLANIDEITDYCYSTSYWNGIPLAILRADEDVKVSRRFIGDIYSEIVGYVGRDSGEVKRLAPYWGEGNWLGA